MICFNIYKYIHGKCVQFFNEVLFLDLQFRRVLSGVELGGVFSDHDFDIVYRKFGVKMGGRNGVNYIAFCGMAEQYAESKWTDPALQSLA